jgi:toxin ParE1/3/4
MARRKSQPATGVVVYSPLAAEDFISNYDHTAAAWGLTQAERYSDLLENTVHEIARHPDKGKRIEGHPEARAVFVKWPKARHGHYIVYRPMLEGIYVLRILHSSMNTPSHSFQ